MSDRATASNERHKCRRVVQEIYQTFVKEPVLTITVCSWCGAILRKHDKFCSQCGGEVVGDE